MSKTIKPQNGDVKLASGKTMSNKAPKNHVSIEEKDWAKQLSGTGRTTYTGAHTHSMDVMLKQSENPSNNNKVDLADYNRHLAKERMEIDNNLRSVNNQNAKSLNRYFCYFL